MSATKDPKTNKWISRFYYTDYTGTRKQAFKRGFNTKKEALDYEREYIKKLEYSNNMTFKSLYDLYIEDMRHRLKETTINKKEYIFRGKILNFFGEMTLDSITPIVIRTWQNKLPNSLASSTIRIINAELSAILNYAYKYYNLKENPCIKAGVIGNLKPQKEFNIISLEEFEIFISNVKIIYYKVLFKLLFYTGIRIGEALALTKKDIDFEKGIIDINKSYSYSTRKISTTKNSSSNRKIKINDKLIKCIHEYLKKIYGLGNKDRIFEVTSTSIDYHLNRALIKSNLPRMRIHDLRHSHATLLIQNGVDIVSVARRLGHSDIKTTLQRYSHLYRDSDEKIALLLDSL